MTPRSIERQFRSFTDCISNDSSILNDEPIAEHRLDCSQTLTPHIRYTTN